jgi:hypothetical protein
VALADFGLAFFALGRELRAPGEELVAALTLSIVAAPVTPLLIVPLIAPFEFAASHSAEELASSAGPFAAAF